MTRIGDRKFVTIRRAGEDIINAIDVDTTKLRDVLIRVWQTAYAAGQQDERDRAAGAS